MCMFALECVCARALTSERLSVFVNICEVSWFVGV
jgi:hypothetical protein